MPEAKAERTRLQLEEDIAHLSGAEIDALMEVAGLPDSVLIPRLMLYRVWSNLRRASYANTGGDSWRAFFMVAEARIKVEIRIPVGIISSGPHDMYLARLLEERLGISTVADLCRSSAKNLTEAGFSREEIAVIEDMLGQKDLGLMG